MCKHRQNFTTFKKVCQKYTLFGHGGGPGTVKCEHDPYYSEKHKNLILNVGDLTITISVRCFDQVLWSGALVGCFDQVLWSGASVE